MTRKPTYDSEPRPEVMAETHKYEGKPRQELMQLRQAAIARHDWLAMQTITYVLNLTFKD